MIKAICKPQPAFEETTFSFYLATFFNIHTHIGQHACMAWANVGVYIKRCGQIEGKSCLFKCWLWLTDSLNHKTGSLQE